MKNEERFKTAEGRDSAFVKWCDARPCSKCELYKIKDGSYSGCQFLWLALEAEEEKLESCPFCGGETHNNLGRLKVGVVHYWVECISPDCMYRSAHYTDKEEAIAAHNRVARAARAAEKGNAK